MGVRVVPAAVKRFGRFGRIAGRGGIVIRALLRVEPGNFSIQRATNQKHAVKNRSQWKNHIKTGCGADINHAGQKQH